MAVVSLMDYEWILNFYWILYGIAVLSLALVLVIGQEVNGATRWINLGFTTFQPSELAKILLILFFARFIMRHEEDLNDKWTLLKYAGLCGVPLALIIVEPNLSTTICTALVLCLIIYIGGLSYRFILRVLLILIPVTVIFLSIAVQPNQPFLKEYQQKRILAFLEPEKYASDEAYQQNNSVMAIGSGQLTGKGLDNNTTTSVKNGNFISGASDRFYLCDRGRRTGICGQLYCDCLIAFDRDTMYTDRDKSTEPGREDHLLRGGRPDRHTEFYQYCRGHQNDPQHRSPSPLCKLWPDLAGQSVHRHWICTECRFTAEKISIRSEGSMNIGLIAHDSKKDFDAELLHRIPWDLEQTQSVCHWNHRPADRGSD